MLIFYESVCMLIAIRDLQSGPVTNYASASRPLSFRRDTIRTFARFDNRNAYNYRNGTQIITGISWRFA